MKRSKNPDVTKREFTPDEIEAVRSAIRAAREDMRAWHEARRVDPIKMITPIGPCYPGRRL